MRRLGMLHKTLMLAVASVLTCAYATSASADLCVRIEGGGTFAVLKTKYKLQLPFDPTTQKNSCEPIGGFEYTSVPGGSGGRISGSICIDTDVQLTYHYTYHNSEKNPPWFEGYFESGLCVFDVRSTPSEKDGVEGKCRLTALAGPTPASHTHISIVKRGWIWNCAYDVHRTNLPQQ